MTKITYKKSEGFTELDNSHSSKSDLRDNKRFTLQYHGNPTKLEKSIESELEQMGYDVIRNELNSEKGSFGDEVMNIKLNMYAQKRRDIKGKALTERFNSTLPLLVAGIIIIIVGIASPQLLPIVYIGVLMAIIGGYCLFAEPKNKVFTYEPAGVCLWIFGDGEGHIGTITEKVTEGGHKKAGAMRSIQTAYVKGEIELDVRGDTPLINEYHIQKLLKDKDKTSFSFGEIMKAAFKKEKELTLEDEKKYEKLPENIYKVKDVLNEDMKLLKNKFSKFSGMA